MCLYSILSVMLRKIVYVIYCVFWSSQEQFSLLSSFYFSLFDDGKRIKHEILIVLEHSRRKMSTSISCAFIYVRVCALFHLRAFWDKNTDRETLTELLSSMVTCSTMTDNVILWALVSSWCVCVCVWLLPTHEYASMLLKHIKYFLKWEMKTLSGHLDVKRVVCNKHIFLTAIVYRIKGSETHILMF